MSLPPQSSDSPPRRQEAGQLLERFEEAWQNGSTPPLESFVPGSDDPSRSQILRELIKIDLDRRWRQTSPAVQRSRVEDYLKHWPELARSSQVMLELIREEYWARCCWGKAPGHAEYLTRFPQFKGELAKVLPAVDAELAAEMASVAPKDHRRALVPARSAAPQPLSSVGAVMDLLRRCQLLKPEQLEYLNRKSRKLPPQPLAFVKELVRRGWLTPYQVNQLIPGNVNDLVLGPYVLLERLGAGGTGQVFKARHRGMDRVVALKLIRPDLLTDAEVVARFYREMRLVSQLDHPNVVHAYDAGPVALAAIGGGPSPGTMHFLAMEFVEGVDLGKLVKQGGALPVMQACEYVRQAALGLQHVHERGLVHRDIKAHNLIMSRKDGLIKLADLGLARLPHAVDGEVTAAFTMKTTGTLTPENAMLIGTADFLSPEQALDFHNADIRADIYSLGCTLHFLLTGQPPFPGCSLAQKVAKHLQAEPPAIEGFRSDVPPALSGLLRRMMAKRPEDRPQTPAEVVQHLQALLANGSARPRSKRARKWVAPAVITGGRPRSRRRVYALAAIACLLVGAGLILVFGSGRTFAPVTAKDARGELAELQRRAADPAADAAGLRRDLLRLAMRYPGTPEALETQEWLRKLPSPLDVLSAMNIRPEERFKWQPDELCAVLGEHRGRPWGSPWTTLRCAAVSGDGKLLAAAGDDCLVRVWDLETKKLRTALYGHTKSVGALAITFDGRLLASVSIEGVKLWDVAQGQLSQELPVPAGEIHAVAFTPNGKLLASAGKDEVRLWTVSPDRKVLDPARSILKGHKGAVNALAFQPGGRLLASAGEDQLVKLWEVEAGTEWASLPGHTGPVTALSFAADGELLASGSTIEKQSAGEIKLWEVAPHRERPGFKVRTNWPVYTLAIAPDGKTITTAANAFPDRDVHSYESLTGKELPLLRESAPIGAVFYPPGSQALALVSRGVTLWDMTTRKAEPAYLDRRGSFVQSVAFSPDCKTLVTAGVWIDPSDPRELELVLGAGPPELKLWDLTTGKVVHALKIKNRVNALAFSPDGSMLATGEIDGVVRLWDPAGGKEWHSLKVYNPGDRGNIASMNIAFSPNGKTLVIGEYIPRSNEKDAARPGKLTCVDLDHLDAAPSVPVVHAEGVNSFAFSPDGTTLATSGRDRTVKLWDWPAMKERASLPGHWTEQNFVRYKPDGQTLFITSSLPGESSMTAWDIAGGREKSRVRGRSVVFLHGKLWTTVNDGAIIAWDEATGKRIQDLRLLGAFHSAALANDGRHLAIAASHGLVYILDMSNFAPKK